MSRSRSALLIVLGAAVFVVGTGFAFLAVRGGDDSAARVEAQAVTPAQQSGQATTPATVPAFEVPAGHQALAITVPYVNGVAGYVKANDKVNVFGTVKPNNPAPARVTPTPAAKLVLSDIQVLAVSAPSAGATNAQSTTFVLALTPAEAEKLVYFQTFESIYLSLAREDQGRVDAPGTFGPNLF